MASVTIKPDQFVELKYRVPETGFVKFEVDAESPVATYVLGPNRFSGFWKVARNSNFTEAFRIQEISRNRKYASPSNGSWYLVIMNPNKREPVDVEYEVYY